MTSRPPRGDRIEMRLQGFAPAALRCVASASPDGTALVFAAADRPREAAVEACRGSGPLTFAPSSTRPSRGSMAILSGHASRASSCAQPPGTSRRSQTQMSATSIGDRRLAPDRRSGATARCSRPRRSRRATVGSVAAASHRARHQPQVDRVGHVGRLGDVRDHRLGDRPAEQRLVGAQRVEAELAARSHRRDRASAARRSSGTAAAATGRCRRSECCSAPSRLSGRRISAVCATALNGPPRCSMRGVERRSAVAGACSRTWFMYCVVASCSKNSTARAGQSVTSRASCSSIAAVPLRRR